MKVASCSVLLLASIAGFAQVPQPPGDGTPSVATGSIPLTYTGGDSRVSIGIDIAPLSEAAFEAMYRRADQALYKAKGAGRNRYVLSDVAQALA